MWNQKITTVFEWIIITIGIIVLSFVSYLVFSYKFDSYTSYPMETNALMQILVALGVFVLGLAINKATEKLSLKVKDYVCFAIMIVSAGIILIIGMTYVQQTKINQISDAQAVYILSKQFAAGDYTAIVPKDSYMSLWPFQSGIIFIFEKLGKLFRTDSEILYQRINVFFLVILVVAGFQIIRHYTRSVGACFCYAALMCTYFPIIFFSFLMYGNNPSMCLMVFSSWTFGILMKTDVTWKKVLSGFGFFSSTVLACLFKTTCKIYLLALLIVLVLYVIKTRKWTLVIFGVITLIVSLFSVNVAQKYYENKAGNICGDGVPAVAFIAMGLQYGGDERIPGGWNGYHSDLYIETGYDSSATKEISIQSINESVQQFKENPEFAREFFYNKLLKQWANETHSVFWNVDNLKDTETSFDYWRKFLEYNIYDSWLPFIDFHESVVYGFC